MSHQVQKVATKVFLENGQYAECYRCCGNPQTDSWITVVNPERLPAAALQEAIAKHAAGVEARHTRMETALPLVRGCACTLDSAAMAAAMERECGSLKAGVTLPQLAGHRVEIMHATAWNDEEVKIYCVCCTGAGVHTEVVGVFNRSDAQVEGQVRRSMERAAIRHSAHEWAASAQQQR